MLSKGWATGRDEAKKAVLVRKLERIKHRFDEHVDEFVDFMAPADAPYIYGRFERRARRCLVSFLMASLLGCLLAFLLTAGSTSGLAWYLYGGFGVLLFMAAVVILDLALDLLPDPAFDRWFWACYVPPMVLSVAMLALLAFARLAPPEYAKWFLDTQGAILIALEGGLLLVGAVSLAGVTVFGLSGRLARGYEKHSNVIEGLDRRINQRRSGDEPRRQPVQGVEQLQVAEIDGGRLHEGRAHDHPAATLHGGGTATAVLLPLAFWGVALLPAPVDAHTIMLDRTGSIAEPETLDQRLVEAVASQDLIPPELGLVLFGEHVLSAPRSVLNLAPGKRTDVIRFEAVEKEAKKQAREQVRKLLGEALAKRESGKASCSSIYDVILRALIGKKPVLIITDGLEECSRRPPPPFSDQSSDSRRGEGIFIVLVRAKGDRPPASTLLSQRAKQIKTVLPGATLYLEPELERAITDFFSVSGSLVPVKR